MEGDTCRDTHDCISHCKASFHTCMREETTEGGSVSLTSTPQGFRPLYQCIRYQQWN